MSSTSQQSVDASVTANVAPDIYVFSACLRPWAVDVATMDPSSMASNIRIKHNINSHGPDRECDSNEQLQHRPAG